MKIRVNKSIMLATLAAAVFAAPSVSMAEGIDSKIDQKDKDISELKGQQQKIVNQVSTVESEIAAIFDKGAELKEQQLGLEKQSKNLKAEITTLEGRIEKRTEAIKNQGRNIQVNGQGSKMLEIVLDSSSIVDAVNRIQAVSTILNANNKLIVQQKEDKKAVEDKKVENQQKLKDLDQTAADLEAEKSNLVAKQTELNDLKSSVDSNIATAESSKSALVKEQEAAAKQAEKQKQAAAEKAKAKKEEKMPETSPANSSNNEETAPENNSSDNSSDKQTPDNNNVSKEEPTPPGPSGPPSNSSDATYQALNALRQSHGLNPVSWDAGLAASATSRAAMMEGAGWQIPSDHWTRGDEVIAFMFGAGNSVIMAWYNETNMTSPSGTGHRDWELNPSMTRVGFGYSGSTIVGHSG